MKPPKKPRATGFYLSNGLSKSGDWPDELHLGTLESGHLEKGAGTAKEFAIGFGVFGIVAILLVAIHILWVAE